VFAGEELKADLTPFLVRSPSSMPAAESILFDQLIVYYCPIEAVFPAAKFIDFAGLGLIECSAEASPYRLKK
jgi:hypothetical protein